MNKKNLIFIGAPGSGKGTISNLLMELAPLAHISTGDILRDEIKRDTELGRQAAVSFLTKSLSVWSKNALPKTIAKQALSLTVSPALSIRQNFSTKFLQTWA